MGLVSVIVHGTINPYRIMWLYVMFDLPVTTKRQRKQATDFRKQLLKLGFDMVQFSVYNRFCSGKERAEVLTGKVGRFLPNDGKVSILCITDKQYANSVNFERSSRVKNKNLDQLTLF